MARHNADNCSISFHSGSLSTRRQAEASEAQTKVGIKDKSASSFPYVLFLVRISLTKQAKTWVECYKNHRADITSSIYTRLYIQGVLTVALPR
jgi:hypothetical protein